MKFRRHTDIIPKEYKDQNLPFEASQKSSYSLSIFKHTHHSTSCEHTHVFMHKNSGFYFRISFFLVYFALTYSPNTPTHSVMNEKNKQNDGLKQAVTFEDKRIAIISDIDLSIQQNQRQRLAAFATILCTAGNGELSVNNRRLAIQQGDLLVCTSGDTIEGHHRTDNFKAVGFYLSKEFFDELSSMPLGIVNARVYIQEHPLLHINEHAANIFIQYYNLIHSKLATENPVKHHKLVTDLLLQAFMYEFHDTLEENAEKLPVFKFTSADNIYKNFVELVLQTYPKPRSVEWYASKLNVTAKYLSSVTKHCSGETASAIINRYVLEDVKRNLMRPEKSIKEVVCELDFPSISFFGKYVKRHLGKSPKHYREDLIKK